MVPKLDKSQAQAQAKPMPGIQSTPLARQAVAISVTGLMLPISLLECITVTSTVDGRIAAITAAACRKRGHGKVTAHPQHGHSTVTTQHQDGHITATARSQRGLSTVTARPLHGHSNVNGLAPVDGQASIHDTVTASVHHLSTICPPSVHHLSTIDFKLHQSPLVGRPIPN